MVVWIVKSKRVVFTTEYGVIQIPSVMKNLVVEVITYANVTLAKNLSIVRMATVV